MAEAMDSIKDHEPAEIRMDLKRERRVCSLDSREFGGMGFRAVNHLAGRDTVGAACGIRPCRDIQMPFQLP